MIKPCVCNGTPAANYQDKLYGPGKRVFTPGKKGGDTCTVCGRKG